MGAKRVEKSVDEGTLMNNHLHFFAANFGSRWEISPLLGKEDLKVQCLFLLSLYVKFRGIHCACDSTIAVHSNSSNLPNYFFLVYLAFFWFYYIVFFGGKGWIYLGSLVHMFPLFYVYFHYYFYHSSMLKFAHITISKDIVSFKIWILFNRVESMLRETK